MPKSRPNLNIEIVWERTGDRPLKGSPSPEQVNAMGQELHRIKESCGGVDLSIAIVAAAKNPDNPLHGQFEWDVEKAAMMQWIKTANDLLHAFRPMQTRDVELTGKQRLSPYVSIPMSRAIESGIVEREEGGETPGRFFTLDRRDKDETVQQLIARQDVQEIADLLDRIEAHTNNGIDLRFLARAIRRAMRLVGIT